MIKQNRQLEKIWFPENLRIPREPSEDTAYRAGNKEERVLFTFCRFVGQIPRGIG